MIREIKATKVQGPPGVQGVQGDAAICADDEDSCDSIIDDKIDEKLNDYVTQSELADILYDEGYIKFGEKLNINFGVVMIYI